MTFLEELCKAHGVQIVAHSQGRYRLRGVRIVDYWPRSRKHTAYLVEENRTAYGVTPAEAVRLAKGEYLEGRTWEPRKFRKRAYSMNKTQRARWIAGGARA